MSTRDEHEWGQTPEMFGPRHDYRESLLVRAIRRLDPPPGRDALDAGAGAGSLALRLARLGFRVTATDGSAAFATRLGSMLDAAPGGPHRALRSDMHALSLADASFDLVVCAEVLEHLDDDATAAGELLRVLRPGGHCVISVPAGPRRYDWTDRWAGHRRRYDKDGLGRLLAAAGFTEVDVVAWGFPVTGFYHRRIYRPLLGRRLDRGGDRDANTLQRPARGWMTRVLRQALRIDTLFMGRFPGYMGFIATARRPE